MKPRATTTRPNPRHPRASLAGTATLITHGGTCPHKEARMAQRQQYRIESVDDQGNWSADVVGMEHDNQFATKADAQAAIAFLRTLGEEWATARPRRYELYTAAHF